MAMYLVVGDCDLGTFNDEKIMGDDAEWFPMFIKVEADTAQMAMNRVRLAAKTGELLPILAGGENKVCDVSDLSCVDLNDVPEFVIV